MKYLSNTKMNKMVSDSFVMPVAVITVLPVYVQRITISLKHNLFEILSMYQDCPSIYQFIHYPDSAVGQHKILLCICVYENKVMSVVRLVLKLPKG